MHARALMALEQDQTRLQPKLLLALRLALEQVLAQLLAQVQEVWWPWCKRQSGKDSASTVP